jgi:RNA recognition motif. (a.k.a. RRM, RBD, or RNP domain)
MAYNPETMSFELGDNDCDMVYVSGLPPDATEADIAEHFGSIGVVKFDKKQNKHKIWMYRDKMTGAPKGDCTVTYEGAGLPTLAACMRLLRQPWTCICILQNGYKCQQDSA